MGLARSLLCALDAASADALAAEAALEPTLARIRARARTRWPGVDLADEAFARALAERLEPVTIEALQTLHTDDIYAATACAQGDSTAVAEVTATIVRPAVAAALPADPNRDDLMQRLVTRLFVGEDGQPGRVAQYAGRGSLKGWTRVAVLRAVKDLRRGQARAPRVDGFIDDLLATPGGSDPEIQEIRAQCGEHFRAAFAAAVDGLQPDDRRMLRQHHLRAMTLDHLAKIDGVHRVTAARRLARARRRLLDATKAELRDRLATTGRDIDSVLKIVGSRLEVSVDRLLATREGEPTDKK